MFISGKVTRSMWELGTNQKKFITILMLPMIVARACIMLTEHTIYLFYHSLFFKKNQRSSLQGALTKSQFTGKTLRHCDIESIRIYC
jgi:hypothetical protein